MNLFLLLLTSLEILYIELKTLQQVLSLTVIPTILLVSSFHVCSFLFSARLKMLSAEIDKLRDEFVRANQEKAQQQVPPPAPPTQPQNQYYDQYFDPTEDPLAFMRGPRRRANSFSGHGGMMRCIDQSSLLLLLR